MKKRPYSWVTSEMFDEMLREVMDDETSDGLLAVPGAYEVFSEHFNNEVLDRLKKKRAEEEDTAGYPTVVAEDEEAQHETA